MLEMHRQRIDRVTYSGTCTACLASEPRILLRSVSAWPRLHFCSVGFGSDPVGLRQLWRPSLLSIRARLCFQELDLQKTRCISPPSPLPFTETFNSSGPGTAQISPLGRSKLAGTGPSDDFHC